MQIVEFVPLTAVDPIYFENTFISDAEKQGEKAYQLLVQAMEDMERVALAKFVWRGKDGLYVIRSVQGRLLLHRDALPGRNSRVRGEAQSATKNPVPPN